MTCANTSLPAYIRCSHDGLHRRVANLASTVQVGDRKIHEKALSVPTFTGSPLDNVGTLLEKDMKRTTSTENKTLVLEAFDTLFNKRDYVAAERYRSPNYIQHSAHIEPGREGFFSLIKSIPPTLKYEPGLIVAEEEFVIVHGRFSGHGQPKNWIAADIVRIVDGMLVEHWDVIEDEASRTESKSGRPMFGNDFSE